MYFPWWGTVTVVGYVPRSAKIFTHRISERYQLVRWELHLDYVNRFRTEYGMASAVTSSSVATSSYSGSKIEKYWNSFPTRIRSCRKISQIVLPSTNIVLLVVVQWRRNNRNFEGDMRVKWDSCRGMWLRSASALTCRVWGSYGKTRAEGLVHGVTF
jgi:hypothetical protein